MKLSLAQCSISSPFITSTIFQKITKRSRPKIRPKLPVIRTLKFCNKGASGRDYVLLFRRTLAAPVLRSHGCLPEVHSQVQVEDVGKKRPNICPGITHLKIRTGTKTNKQPFIRVKAAIFCSCFFLFLCQCIVAVSSSNSFLFLLTQTIIVKFVIKK